MRATLVSLASPVVFVVAVATATGLGLPGIVQERLRDVPGETAQQP